MAAGRFARYRLYLRQRPVMLAALSLLALGFFLGVTMLSHVYREQRAALGNRWSARGLADLNAQNYDAAASDFRAALLYSRDEYSYQLNLAEALIGMQRTPEASAYLLNLWDREPENGLVNVELARIAAQQGRTDDAIRYYHGAVYSAWPPDQGEKRRNARLELIELLLSMHRETEAQSELIALAANTGEDSAQQARVGDLFARADDYEHALAAYRTSLHLNHRNPAALSGAGYAAYELGQYAVAQRYLQAAVTSDPHDSESAERLKIAEMVLRMDPFRRELSATARSRIVVEAFNTAGARLKSCVLPAGSAAKGPTTDSALSDQWSRLKPRITEFGLRRNPDLVETAMDLVFRIERETSNICGTPTAADLALLLISKEREGS